MGDTFQVKLNITDPELMPKTNMHGQMAQHSIAEPAVATATTCASAVEQKGFFGSYNTNMVIIGIVVFVVLIIIVVSYFFFSKDDKEQKPKQDKSKKKPDKQGPQSTQDKQDVKDKTDVKDKPDAKEKMETGTHCDIVDNVDKDEVEELIRFQKEQKAAKQQAEAKQQADAKQRTEGKQHTNMPINQVSAPLNTSINSLESLIDDTLRQNHTDAKQNNESSTDAKQNNESSTDDIYTYNDYEELPSISPSVMSPSVATPNEIASTDNTTTTAAEPANNSHNCVIRTKDGRFCKNSAVSNGRCTRHQNAKIE